MRTFNMLKTLAAAAFIASLSVAACQRPNSEHDSKAGVTSNPSETPEYTTTATVKDIMEAVVDPSADVVWNAVSFVSNQQGLTETKPRNDEEWVKARHGALLLAEASNLLMVPGRHVAAPHVKSETPGVELEPSEMEALIDKDRGAWNRRAHDLHTAVLEALSAIDAKDPDKLFEVGEHIERACENCHTAYWYPNEKIPDVQVK